MPKTGRPRAIDEHKWTAICAVVSHGGSLEEAAQLLGCAASTIHREKRRNEQFRKQLNEAQVNATLTPYRRMNAASRRSWRAAAWMVEQNRPKRHPADSTPPSFQSPTDAHPVRESRPSIFDGPISPDTAEFGANFFLRLAQLMKERWGIDRSDRDAPVEASTLDAPSSFATEEKSRNLLPDS